jgi:hypothetical protein
MPLLLHLATEVASQEVLGSGEETQTVLRLDEAVALIGEQQILVHDSGIFERSDDLL